MTHLNFNVDIPTLPASDNNARIQAIRKNLLSDMLSFNIKASEQHRAQKEVTRIRDKKDS